MTTPVRRAALLALLVAQNCAVALVMHESTAGRARSEPYSRAQAVVVIEVVKGAVALGTALTYLSPGAARARILSRDAWALAVPAALYVVQNYLHFVAIANLAPGVFQVLYQLKVLTTAVFSVALLRRQLSVRQWLALVVLVMGVALVQAGGGLLTALVVRHTDSILKGYAVSLSIVLGALLGALLFGYALTPLYVLGAALALASTAMYQWRPPERRDEPA